ncbi:hypothetical protein C1I98_02610 [Spongiactinospora gelatinilytica]|uniref:Uncharacterized protein n=1 Tax=Spongiactinospora gelatinilytica TaxID=2666298 RepID=A0A2W2HW79_9ACTN|nr:hypothetical protein C1I98_02610 [Spongiactinospora gelatinilytica]
MSGRPPPYGCFAHTGPGQGRRAVRAGRWGSQIFGVVIRELPVYRGWEQEIAVGGVFECWRDIVGAELGARTRPESFTDGEVVHPRGPGGGVRRDPVAGDGAGRTGERGAGRGHCPPGEGPGAQRGPRPSGRCPAQAGGVGSLGRLSSGCGGMVCGCSVVRFE